MAKQLIFRGLVYVCLMLGVIGQYNEEQTVSERLKELEKQQNNCAREITNINKALADQRYHADRDITNLRKALAEQRKALANQEYSADRDITNLRKALAEQRKALSNQEYSADRDITNLRKAQAEQREVLANQKYSADRDITNLRKVLAEQSSLSNSLVASLEQLNARNVELLNFSRSGQSARERRQQVTQSTVAFTAYMDHDVYHLGINQVIPYNNVITNIGAAFSTHTHTFTCHVSGLYLFAFTVSENGNKEIVAKLVIDGKNLLDGIANPQHDFHDQQGGNIVIVWVSEGQSVWVENYYGNDAHLHSTDTYRFVSFSGVLLKAGATK